NKISTTMLRNCDPVMLFNEEDLYVSKCKKCERVSLSINNLLLRFNSKEFKTLSQLILKLSFRNNSVRFPDGELRLILNTGHKDIQCSFKAHEFAKLKSALTESLLLMNAHAIL